MGGQENNTAIDDHSHYIVLLFYRIYCSKYLDYISTIAKWLMEYFWFNDVGNLGLPECNCLLHTGGALAHTEILEIIILLPGNARGVMAE